MRGENCIAIAKSHTEMAKFKTKDDGDYMEMRDTIATIRDQGIANQPQQPGPWDLLLSSVRHSRKARSTP